MSVESRLSEELYDAYQRAGKEVGYWAHRYREALRRNGGVATARRMLRPLSTGQRKGLDALLEANRADLTLESIVLKPEFRDLFTEVELTVAAQRLEGYVKVAAKHRKMRDRLYPDELDPGRKYQEGARKQVKVNAYERSPKARKECLAYHGYDCSVCGINFKLRYGSIGKDFIHVHHLKPLALVDCEYQLDPVNDLSPVCPNCHAMLHRPDDLLSVEELRTRLNLEGSE